MSKKEYPYLPDEVDIYISYTQREDKDKKVALAFRNACEKHSRLNPHIDSKDLDLNADIYQFMDKLSAARFVVCVLSKEYFTSINCVSEFAGLCHNGFMHNRVFPLFIDHLFDDEKRNKWMNQLVDNEAAKKRVFKNTGKQLNELLEIGIWEFMDKLAGSIREDCKQFMGNNFQGFIDYFLEQISKHNEQRLEEYTKRLEAGIQKELENPDLKKSLSGLTHYLSCDNSKCAAKKLLQNPVNGLSRFYKFCCEYNIFEQPIPSVKKIAGFLFVATIDPRWWLMNEFSLQRGLSSGSFSETSDINSYSIEIVFSKVSGQPALYKQDGATVYPDSSVHCPNIPSFTSDQKANKQVLLKEFYQVEVGVALKEDGLGASQLRTLRGAFKDKLENGTQPFYLIPANEFKALQNAGILEEINKELENLVVFVVIGETFDQNSSSNVISGDIDQLQFFIHKFTLV